MLSKLFEFYGIDWLATFCQFLGMFLIARKNKFGFLVFSIGNVSWIGYAVITGSIAQILANTVVGTINIYGFINWRNKQNEK